MPCDINIDEFSVRRDYAVVDQEGVARTSGPLEVRLMGPFAEDSLHGFSLKSW
jgi:hypothetical protein